MHGIDWGAVGATIAPTLIILGGLIHVVYRLGRLTEKVEGLVHDVEDLRDHAWPITPTMATANAKRRSGR